MGFVSYLEDITDRLNQGIQTWSRDLSEGSADASAPDFKKFQALVLTASRDLARLVNLLDIATDPSLDLANEVNSLRAENERLKNLIGVNVVEQLETSQSFVTQLQSTEQNLRLALAECRSDKPDETKRLEAAMIEALNENRKITNENQIYDREILNLRRKIEKLEIEQKESRSLIEILRIEVEMKTNPEDVYRRY